MKNLKRTLSMILCLVLCTALFAGCGGEDKTPADDQPDEPKVTVNVDDAIGAVGSDIEHTEDTVYKKELVALLGSGFTHLNPLNSAANGAQAGVIAQMAYDQLIERQPDGTFAPGLAESWETEDFQTFVFKLREDVVFHNGEPMTADDVVFTWEANCTNAGAISASTWLDVAECEAISEYEVKMVTKGVNVDFIATLATPTVGILNREACEADPDHGGEIGTGAWIFDEFMADSHIVMVKNENYWGEPVFADKFTFKWVAEETARYIMLENDEVDFGEVSAAYLPAYEKDERFLINSYVMNNTNAIMLNFAEPIIQDKNFRLAVAHATDRQAYTDITLQGYGSTWESGSIWGSRTAYRVPPEELPVLEYNLDLAKEYLAKSAYNGEELTAICTNMAHIASNAIVFQEQMSQLGVTIKIFETDSATQTANTQPGYTGIHFVVGSGVWSSLANSVNNYVTYGTKANKANYKNPYLEELVAKADMTPDGEERAAIYREIQEILAEDLPYIGIFNMALYKMSQQNCGGVVLWQDNHHDYSHAFRVIEE